MGRHLRVQLTLVSHNCVSRAEPKQTPPFAAPVQLRVPAQLKEKQRSFNFSPVFTCTMRTYERSSPFHMWLGMTTRQTNQSKSHRLQERSREEYCYWGVLVAFNVPGQAIVVLHTTVWIASPTHPKPAPRHCRVWYWKPTPQETEQGDKAVQLLQKPMATKWNKSTCYDWYLRRVSYRRIDSSRWRLNNYEIEVQNQYKSTLLMFD